jgi:hypothetical protein
MIPKTKEGLRDYIEATRLVRKSLIQANVPQIYPELFSVVTDYYDLLVEAFFAIE